MGIIDQIESLITIETLPKIVLSTTMFPSLILSLFALFIAIFLPMKLFALVCAKLLRKDLQHFVPLQNTVSCLEDISKSPQKQVNICIALVFDRHLSLEKLIQLFDKRVLKKVNSNGEFMYKELQMYWTSYLNYFFWKKDKDFNLKNHIRLYDYGEEKGESQLNLRDTEEGFCNDEDLQRAFGPLLSKPWKCERSPWELLVVQNFRREKSFEIQEEKKKSVPAVTTSTLLLFRMHHGLCDSHSALNLLLKDLMLLSPKIPITYPRMKWWRQCVCLAFLPMKILWEVVFLSYYAFDWKHCWHPFGIFRKNESEVLSGELLTSFSKDVDAQIIKNLKNKLGVRYNGVMSAILAGACSRAMEKMGQLVPRSISCLGLFTLQDHPEELSNHSFVHAFKLPLDRIKDKKREKQVQEISNKITASKYYTLPHAFTFCSRYLNVTPNFFLRACQVLASTMTVTSVQVEVGQGSFKGIQKVHLLDMFYAIGPGLGRTGVSASMTSFNGRQRIIMTIDRKLCPDEKVFTTMGNFIEDSLNALTTPVAEDFKLSVA